MRHDVSFFWTLDTTVTTEIAHILVFILLSVRDYLAFETNIVYTTNLWGKQICMVCDVQKYGRKYPRYSQLYMGFY